MEFVGFCSLRFFMSWLCFGLVIRIITISHTYDTMPTVAWSTNKTWSKINQPGVDRGE